MERKAAAPRLAASAALCAAVSTAFLVAFAVALVASAAFSAVLVEQLRTIQNNSGTAISSPMSHGKILLEPAGASATTSRAAPETSGNLRFIAWARRGSIAF